MHIYIYMHCLRYGIRYAYNYDILNRIIQFARTEPSIAFRSAGNAGKIYQRTGDLRAKRPALLRASGGKGLGYPAFLVSFFVGT